MIKSIKPQDITCSKEEFSQTFESIKNWDSINNDSRKKILTWIKYFSKKLNLALDNFNELELLEKMKSSEDFFDIWLANKIEEILWLDRDLENHYFKVINNSTLYLKVWLDWKIISANKKFADISWYSIDELIWIETKTLSWDFSMERPREFWDNLWNTVLAWNIWQGSIKNQTKRKDYYRTETTIIPKMLNWEVEYFTVVRTDITESEKQKLELMENNVQLSLMTEDLMEKNSILEKKSLTDALTWLENRGSFDKRLFEEYNRTKKDWTNLALVMLDIDFFKKINDTYWHNIWDIVIKRVAEYIKINFWLTSFKARVWWEEFAIILPSTSAEEARALSEKFRRIIENINLDDIWNITISIWVACYNNKKEYFTDEKTLYKKADEALYLAKNSGRNNVKTCLDLKNKESQ